MSRQSKAASLVCSLALAAALPARAEVTVEFVDPDHYIDAGNARYDVEHELQVLERHLVQLGSHCVAAGERLELRVLNVDLAGRPEWWRPAGRELRVMRDITWPRVDLAYVWRDGAGKVRAEGRDRIIDQSYLWRSATLQGNGEELPYERAMLRDWFEHKLCPSPG